MKKGLIITSLVINSYYVTIWLYVFNLYNTQQQRVDKFMDYFPANLSINMLNWGFVALTVISLVLVVRTKETFSIVQSIILVVQSIFLLLYAVQFL